MLTERERQQWDALFAAAFVAEYEEFRRRPSRAESPAECDAELRANFEQEYAENAITVADLGIMQLRRWRKQEEPKAGEFVSKYADENHR